MREGRGGERESFWSIPSGWRVAYVLTFAVKMVFYTVLVARYEITSGKHSTITEVIVAIAERDSAVTPGFVASTAILMEGVGYIMITYNYLYNKFVKSVIEGHKAEGRAEGKAEMNMRWADWNSRRLEAESRGIPFDEPPPYDES